MYSPLASRTFVFMKITECNKIETKHSRLLIEPRHDKTNKVSVHPAKTQISLGIRLRSQHEEILGPKLPIERTAKTLIRLGRCPGWSESSRGAQSFCWFCHVAAQFLVKVLFVCWTGFLSFCAVTSLYWWKFNQIKWVNSKQDESDLGLLWTRSLFETLINKEAGFERRIQITSRPTGLLITNKPSFYQLLNFSSVKEWLLRTGKMSEGNMVLSKDVYQN